MISPELVKSLVSKEVSEEMRWVILKERCDQWPSLLDEKGIYYIPEINMEIPMAESLVQTFVKNVPFFTDLTKQINKTMTHVLDVNIE